jgi:cobalt-zinc-cadmium efflux system outer membrane protein
MTYRFLKVTGAGLVLLFFFACVRYHPKPISAEHGLVDFDARRLDAPELKDHLLAVHAVDSWPPESWDLKALTLAALYYHPDLDVARARWGVAQAGRIAAGERPNPVLNPSLGYNSSTPADTIRPWIPEVALSLTIETAGKRGIRISQARHLSEAARWNIFSVAWEVRSRLRGAFLDLYSARETESLLASQQEIQAENVRLLDLQLGVGEVSGYEAALARIALDNSRLASLDASRQEAEARVRLADAIGVPVKALEGVEISFDAFEQPPSAVPEGGDIRRKALTTRADILGALAEYAAAEAALRLEIAKQYPDIELGPDYQLDQTDNKWTIGVAFVLPLLNRNKGPIAEAEAGRAESAAHFTALQARVIGELDGALAALSEAAKKSAAADGLLSSLRKREESGKEMWQLGEISKVEYLGLQLEVSAGALARLDALVKTQEAVGLLEDAMQSPMEAAEWIVETPPRGGSKPMKEPKNES